MSYFTIDVRLHPNQQQEILLLMTLSSCRLIYQWAKHVRDCYYARTQQYLPTTQLMVKLFRLKQRKSFLKKVNAQALQQVLWDLDSATQRYLQGRSGPPNSLIPEHVDASVFLNMLCSPLARRVNALSCICPKSARLRCRQALLPSCMPVRTFIRSR